MKSVRRAVLLGIVVATVLVPARPAAALIGIHGQMTLPVAVAVGQTGLAGSFTMANTNTPPQQSEANIVTQIRLALSCGSAGTAANLCSLPDPGVFSISPTATGRAGTSCAGRTFNVSAPDASGIVTFTPSGGMLSVPPPSGIAGANQCAVDFTFNVLKVPTIDADVPTAGPQTSANLAITMQGSVSGGQVVSVPKILVTVMKATPSLATQASRNVAAGTIRDTATVTGVAGVAQPTGSVTFSAYGPNDPTCTGPAAYLTGAQPLSGGTAASPSFPVQLPGIYRFVASYSGDANYFPLTAPCNAPNESVVGLPREPVADINGNGSTDVAVYRPTTGVWYVQSPFSAVKWGEPGDIPVPGDYDGNGSAEHAVYRPGTGVWYLLGPNPRATVWGEPGDIPVPGDYDGDGDIDVAVYRPTTGVWWVQSPFTAVLWGEPGDIPVPGDYDGSGSTELAVYRPSTGVWYLYGPPFRATKWGEPGDIPVPGDYDDNATTDVAVYRPSTGVWYVQSPFNAVKWGEPGDVPVPGDYDGNGSTEFAVYRPTTGVWYLYGPPFRATKWGEPGDIPLPLPNAIYRRFFFPPA